MMNIGLYPVLRTCPDIPTPQIYLPSTLSGTGHTCTSTHAFASGFLRPSITEQTLPSATLRLHLAGYGLYLQFVSYLQISPISSRALPGTHRDRNAPHRASLPHHRTYGSVNGGSADQAGSDSGEDKPE